MIKLYYRLAKPGIIYGNLIPAAGAFLYASGRTVDGALFAATLLGLALIIGSASVFNNYFDREIDAKMERTKSRGFAAGAISATYGLAYGAILGVLGAGMLFWFSSLTALAVAAIGWLVYVGLYTPIKHRSPHALFVGAIAGATPPVVGYTAVTTSLDLTALALFAFLFFWQLPHFIAIAIYRYEEYKAAGIPLFINTPPTDKERRIARATFRWSLIALLIFSLALALTGLFG